MTSTDSGRISQADTMRPPSEVDEAAFGSAIASQGAQGRESRSSAIVPRFGSCGDATHRGPRLRGSALVDLAEPFIEASHATLAFAFAANGPREGKAATHHADGRPVSPALARFSAIDSTWLGLPVDASGRLGPGASLPSIVETFLDPALASWVDRLEPILPGTFYVLPTTTTDRCDVLYACTELAEELVLTLEVAHDGTLDVRVTYPGLDLYVAHVFGAIGWDPQTTADDEALLAPIRRRLFDGRESLFAWDE